MADDPTLMTLTEAELRSWTDGPSGASTSGARDSGTSPDTMPRLLSELADVTAARLAGLDYAPVTLGAFELLRVVGSGAMGQVFAARSLASGREVALKLLNRSRPVAVARLKREFRILADVRHDNLVALDSLTVLPSGVGFFTMELIAGLPFVEYVREGVGAGAGPDSGRLREVLAQLLDALTHVHEAGYVHRDLKPSNVLVSDGGRVVVLDFGLVYGVGAGAETSGVGDEGERLVGTPAYMAPEQAARADVGPPADIYAVGVMLFEALVGHRPFGGKLGGMLIAKQERPPPDPCERATGLDPELVELCLAMLAREPSARPSALEALRVLGQRTRTRGPALPFIGRAREREVLVDALAWVGEHRRPSLVRVRGPSGQGKSSLVRAFAADIGDAAWVLSGRCYERESVPYKGLDMVVEALAGALARLPERDRARAPLLEAERAGPLARVFPILAERLGVEDLDALTAELAHVSPAQLRATAFAGLGELFAVLAAVRPVLVILDDLQWAALDTIRLLEALLATAEDIPMLVVATQRDSASEGDAVALAELDALMSDAEALAGSLVELGLGPLTRTEGVALARAMAGDELSEERAEELHELAGGNPFYLGEVARGAALDSQDSDLDALVARRIAALDRDARRSLELVALAGRPVPVAALAELPGGLAALERLREQEFIRRVGPERAALEAAHDRIREVAVAEIPPADLDRAYAEAAARLADHASAELLAELHARAGQTGVAAGLAERAARQAAEALAFARAASWYERCLEWMAADDPARGPIEGELAQALGNAGRFAEGAKLLLALAERDGARAHELRSRAASYLLNAGHIEAGMDAIAELVAGIGQRLERRPPVLFALMLGSRLMVPSELRRFRPRPVASLSAAERLELAVLHAAADGFASQEVFQTNYWHMRWRAAAARLGHAAEFGQALAAEATIVCSLRDGPRWRQLRARAEQLVPDDARSAVWLAMQDMFVANNRHRYDDLIAAATRLESLLAVAPGDTSWARSNAEPLAAWAKVQAGQLGDAIEISDRLYRVGRESNNPKAERAGICLHVAALVRAGRVERASRSFARLRSDRRRSPDDRFTISDQYGAMAWVESLLRGGRVAEARVACDRLWTDMKRDGLLWVPSYRLLAVALIGLTELGGLFAGRDTLAGRWRVRRAIRQLDGTAERFTGTARLLSAGLALLDGEREDALADLDRAYVAYGVAGCQAQRAVIDQRRAALLSGQAAATCRARAAAYFEREAIVDIEGLVASFLPMV